MENTKPLLSVRDLKVYFDLDEGTVKSVDGISFDAYEGKVVGIVGESGCGKSVTMKSILRIVEKPGRIVEGDILLQKRDNPDEYLNLVKMKENGKEIRAVRGGEIALIPQEPMSAFSPIHTIGDQITEAIMLHNPVDKEEARRICIESLKSVGMSMPEKRIDSYSWQLSGGLRQRAIIAMAIVCKPRLLIADEPTTAIDVTTQAQVLKLLKKLQMERNMGILFITHDLGVIAQMAQYVIVMYLGRIMEKGPVDSIFHNPKHPYTQALLRSIPSIQKTTKVKLPTISGSIPHPFNKPSGCPFHPRCNNWIRGKCEKSLPPEYIVGEGQSASCFLYEGSEEVTHERE